ncbi:MAG: 3-isopropylmalate dehydrogenase [Calditrichaeota bacterium]|nr:MAG: 3-isopropylmalate dehydrogenase [Calditrichota bacterium]
MNQTKKIAVIPGDGIGIDVTREAMKVLQVVQELYNLPLEIREFDYGAERYLRDGTTMPDEQVEDFRQNYDAIFLGALGDPRVPDMTHARDILLGLRFKLDLYVNYRPVKLTDRKLCPLKDKTEEDINFVVFRENTEGLYVGMGGIFKKGTPDEIAVQEDVNTRKGVERIIRYAFEYAKQRGLHKVTMSDKSNALRFGHDLWLRTFEEVGAEYQDIEKQHLYIDALTMQMIKRPEQFEVIVTCNMFGDIITDLGAQLQGGLGVAASGNLNPGSVSMFEPVHGSAPKYAGKNVANPMAAILTLGLMLDYLGYSQVNEAIENAVVAAIRADNTTQDLGGKLGTKEVGDFICSKLKEGN